MQRRTLNQTIAAESNPEGAPAGGISALVYDVVQPLTSNILQKRNDTWVVPYKVSFWVGAFDGFRTMQGFNP